MEKIVLVARDPKDHAHMIALIEAVFPECTVEVVSDAKDASEPMSPPAGRAEETFKGRQAQ
ncbi:MAG: hypothetical protein ACLFUT_12805 [Desulfobacteraceae bacterium]